MENLILTLPINDLAEKISEIILPKIEKAIKTENSEKKVLKKTEIAEKLGISPASVTQLIKKGLIKTTIDNKITYKEFERYLETQNE